MTESHATFPRCSDGGHVHDFRGQSRCPDCGWEGLNFDRIALNRAPRRFSLRWWQQDVPRRRWVWWALMASMVLGLVNDVLAGRGIFG